MKATLEVDLSGNNQERIAEAIDSAIVSALKSLEGKWPRVEFATGVPASAMCISVPRGSVVNIDIRDGLVWSVEFAP